MSVNDLCQEQYEWALEMLGRSDVLCQCKTHEGVYIEQGNDIDSAYKYIAGVFRNNSEKPPFTSLTEARDSIKQAYEDQCGNDCCPLCFRNIED